MKVLLPLLFVLGSEALAQRVDTTPAPPTRALAAATVRREAEAANAKPPVVATAQALGAGTGPMALLLRRADGSLHVHELQPAEALPGYVGADPRGRTTPLAPEDAAATGAAARAAATGPVGPRVLLGRRDAQVTLGTATEPLAVTGEQLDRDAVAKFFRRQRELAGKDPSVLLVPAAETTMQQVVTAHEAALAAGFASVLVDDNGEHAPLAPADDALLGDLVRRLGWPLVAIWGPRLTQPVRRGELLLLADGDTRWDAVAPVYRELIQRGVWQIAFACKREDGTFVKLPVRVALPLR